MTGDDKMIPDLLDAIRAFCQQDAPLVLTQRLSPAADAEIVHLVTLLTAPLPADYRTFLQINEIEHAFSGNFVCFDIQAVEREWAMKTHLLESGAFDDGRITRHQEQG